MRYRRAFTPGGTYFFIVNLADRSGRLLTEHIDVLRQAVRTVRQRHPFEPIAWVVLPDHMHAIWTLPAGDADFSTRWMLIKAAFSRGIPSGGACRASLRRKGERGIWQRRFWEHQIRDERDLVCHVDYVHINPVKHGHAKRACEWRFSSIHRYITRGVLTPGWACELDTKDMGGERAG